MAMVIACGAFTTPPLLHNAKSQTARKRSRRPSSIEQKNMVATVLVFHKRNQSSTAVTRQMLWDRGMIAEPAYLNAPGELAILNPCYLDSDQDGWVSTTDLLNVLSVYGMSCPD